MKTNKRFVAGMFALALALALTFGLAVIACSGKAQAQTSGGGKENPATDFSYDMTADGKGILIKSYTGGAGAVVIPAKIEDMPVLEIGDGVFKGSYMTFSDPYNPLSGKVNTNEKAGITSIFIPNTVTKIGSSAFDTTAITSVV